MNTNYHAATTPFFAVSSDCFICVLQQTSASRYRPPIQPTGTDPLTLLDRRSAQSGEGRRGFGSGKDCHLVAGTFFLDLVYRACTYLIDIEQNVQRTESTANQTYRARTYLIDSEPNVQSTDIPHRQLTKRTEHGRTP